jgi:hypothetical protein
MPSAIDRSAAKLHYYLGLYFLFFTWLFAFSGLLLNHSWKFAEFWPNRRVSVFERQFSPLPAGGAVLQARALMQQVGIEGEVQLPGRIEMGRLDFRVVRPGCSFEIKADPAQGRARIERTEVNLWGTMRALHTFKGGRGNQRNWILTTVWAVSMDALAVGLLVMVLTGVYIWWGTKSKRAPGLLALVAGVAACAWLVFGLR